MELEGNFFTVLTLKLGTWRIHYAISVPLNKTLPEPGGGRGSGTPATPVVVLPAARAIERACGGFNTGIQHW